MNEVFRRLRGFVFIFFILLFLWGWNDYYAKRVPDETRKLAAPILAANSLTFAYLVGVEGVGHHGIAPAIATIARTCNTHVLYEMKRLRGDQERKFSKGIKYQVSKFRSTHYSSPEVIILEDASFPSGENCRTCSQRMKKSTGHYDLEWMHKELLKNAPNMTIKYLYLNRDFYRTVASHPEFDATFEHHAHVLHDFMWYINSEYGIINGMYPNLWRQINYEWFTNMDKYNCTAIVSAVIDFMEWDHCDMEFACQSLNETLRKETKKEIIPEDYAYAQTFNVTLPIPVLDISPNRTYNFTTVVSERVPINIKADIGPRKVKQTAKTMVSIEPGLVPAGGAVSNKVSMLYLLGLQGTDQNKVSTALALMAKAAGYHIVHMHPGLLRAQRYLQAAEFKDTFGNLTTSDFAGTNKVLVLFHMAFPVTEDLTEPLEMGNKSRSGAYNLLWVVAQAKEVEIKVNFLYLQRDFQHTLASVPALLRSQPVEKRVEVLSDYALHIQQEYQRIESKQTGLWAQIKYEWFVRMSSSTVDCSEVVTAFARYFSWDLTGVLRSCSALSTLMFPVPAVATDSADSADSTGSAGSADVMHFMAGDIAVIAAAQVNVSVPMLRLFVPPALGGESQARMYHRQHIRQQWKRSSLTKPLPPGSSIRSPGNTPGGGNQQQLRIWESTTTQTFSQVPVVPKVSVVPYFPNAVSLLYLVGLPGPGSAVALEAAAGALAIIARAAKYHVSLQDPLLASAQKSQRDMVFQQQLFGFKTSKAVTSNKVLLLLYTSDAVAKECLLWSWSQAQEARVSILYLFLQRELRLSYLGSLSDKHLAANSNDRTVVAKVRQLQDDVMLIQEEYQRIESKQAGLWAQLKYEWFVEAASVPDTGSADNCTALVTAIARHAGWERCDKRRACSGIKASNFDHPVSKDTIQDQLATNLNMTLQQVPYVSFMPIRVTSTGIGGITYGEGDVADVNVDVDADADFEAARDGGQRNRVFRSSGMWHMGKRTAVVTPVRV